MAFNNFSETSTFQKKLTKVILAKLMSYGSEVLRFCSLLSFLKGNQLCEEQVGLSGYSCGCLARVLKLSQTTVSQT